MDLPQPDDVPDDGGDETVRCRDHEGGRAARGEGRPPTSSPELRTNEVCAPCAEPIHLELRWDHITYGDVGGGGRWGCGDSGS